MNKSRGDGEIGGKAMKKKIEKQMMKQMDRRVREDVPELGVLDSNKGVKSRKRL